MIHGALRHELTGDAALATGKKTTRRKSRPAGTDRSVYLDFCRLLAEKDFAGALNCALRLSPAQEALVACYVLLRAALHEKPSKNLELTLGAVTTAIAKLQSQKGIVWFQYFPPGIMADTVARLSGHPDLVLRIQGQQHFDSSLHSGIIAYYVRALTRLSKKHHHLKPLVSEIHALMPPQAELDVEESKTQTVKTASSIAGKTTRRKNPRGAHQMDVSPEIVRKVVRQYSPSGKRLDVNEYEMADAFVDLANGILMASDLSMEAEFQKLLILLEDRFEEAVASIRNREAVQGIHIRPKVAKRTTETLRLLAHTAGLRDDPQFHPAFFRVFVRLLIRHYPIIRQHFGSRAPSLLLHTLNGAGPQTQRANTREALTQIRQVESKTMREMLLGELGSFLEEPDPMRNMPEIVNEALLLSVDPADNGEFEGWE